MDEVARIYVCGGANCSRKDSAAIRIAFRRSIEAAQLETSITLVKKVGACLGLCDFGPNLMVYPEGTWYCGVTPADVNEIIEIHCLQGRIIERLKGPEPEWAD
jgi:(2Fe-2S) ferredoxin